MPMAIPIAERWFEKRSMADGVTLIYEPHVVPLLRCNIWHVRGRDKDLMVDTGTGLTSLVAFARDILDKPVAAVATHVHLDHIGGHHEFAESIVHAEEAEGLRSTPNALNLIDETFDAGNLASLSWPPIEGYETPDSMVTALPREGFDLSSYRLKPAQGIKTVEEGDIVDLGDRAFQVLHLPGHSPGGIGLWEAKTATLFSGDTLYDGPLIDDLEHSDIAQYRRSLERLLSLPVETVHAGHDPSFGRERLRALVRQQLAVWDESALTR